MPTTVRIPSDVLRAIDRQAVWRRMTRNRYIVEALRARVEADQRSQPVPAELLEQMRAWRRDPARNKLVDKMQRLIRSGRRSKKPLAL
jgi:hypothetical protein